MTITRVFIHGLESSGHGTKGIFFKEHYPAMIVEDYQGSFTERMEKLHGILDDKRNLILAGSSYGGLMAAVYTCLNPAKVIKLILLAPALNLDEFSPCKASLLETPTILYHGSKDDVVPPLPVKEIAERVFRNLTYNLIEDDHSLHLNFPSLPWDRLLRE